MYRRMLIPLDGSKTAEKILPYARSLAGKLKISVEFMGVVDLAEMAAHVSVDKTHYIPTLVEDVVRRGKSYLQGIAHSFAGVSVKCVIKKGKPEDVIIEQAGADKNTLIAMATHGWSGLNRWLLGSVAEKVLRGSSNPLLLLRANEKARSAGWF
jgi:nucleotide-binding universal stress UspA family protein